MTSHRQKDQIDVSSGSVINNRVPILSMLASHVFTEALPKLPSASCTGSSVDQGSNVQPTELAWYELVSKYLNWHLFMHHLTFWIIQLYSTEHDYTRILNFKLSDLQAMSG